MKSPVPLLAAIVAISFFSGCDTESPGTSTGASGQGSGSGVPGGDTSGPGADKVSVPFCRDKVEVLSGIDAAIEGTDLRALVARVSTKLEGKWMGDPNNGTSGKSKVEVQPSLSGEAGSVEISYGAGQVRLIRKEFVDCSPGVACAGIFVRCIDEIQVDLDLKVSSTSGALSEMLVATVSIPDSRDPDSKDPAAQPGPGAKDKGSPTITVESTVDPAKFQGSASITASSMDPNFQLSAHRLKFACTFEQEKATRAVISSFVEVRSGTVMGAGVIPLYELEVAPK